MSMPSEKAASDKVTSLLQSLNAEQILQVINFIEFIKLKRGNEEPENSFLSVIAKDADPTVTLEEVRSRLSSIRGNLSDSIIQNRDERL